MSVVSVAEWLWQWTFTLVAAEICLGKYSVTSVISYDTAKIALVPLWNSHFTHHKTVSPVFNGCDVVTPSPSDAGMLSD